MFPTFPITLYGRPWEIVTIGSDQTDYILANNIQSLPDEFPRKILVRINSGVTVSSSSTSTAAFRTGSLPTNVMRLRIVNAGSIIGAGGAGGNGGFVSGVCQSPSAGNPGGDALDTTLDIDIDNTNGNIFGGGGGGGGGGAGFSFLPGPTTYSAAGGGGGGGAGDTGGGGGSGGTNAGGSCNSPGANGTAGSTTGGGGGSGGSCPSSTTGGAGGNGGEYGSSGATGGSGSGSSCTTAGAAGGAAGKAVELNGNVIRWFGGNNPTQVKGDVS